MRDGVVIAGDTILTGITPAIGLYPNSRPDPLGDYLETLRWYRGARAARRLHRATASRSRDPAGRAARDREPITRDRLDRAEAALDGTPLLGVRRVARRCSTTTSRPTLRRFATAESLAHLERLVLEGRAARAGPAYVRGAADTIDGMKPLRIGVLAVQGNFREHAQMLRRLGADVVEVRKPEQLDGLDGLVIPGGESTTFTRLMRLYGLDEAIRRFERPVFGTCAGMIVLDRDHLGLVDVAVRRNAFGRQVASFETDLDVAGDRRAGARRLHPRAVGRGGRARAWRCSPRSTAGRCSRARAGSSSPRSIRS